MINNKYIIKGIIIKLYKSLIYTLSNKYIDNGNIYNKKYNFTRYLISINKHYKKFNVGKK